MSGDTGIEEQPLIFYSSEMTAAKKILINKHKALIKQTTGIYVQERWRTGSPMQG